MERQAAITDGEALVCSVLWSKTIWAARASLPQKADGPRRAQSVDAIEAASKK
jgi:hypothetical protein